MTNKKQSRFVPAMSSQFDLKYATDAVFNWGELFF